MRLLLYILVFITPLIFVNNTNELYEFPKMFFVYFIGTTLVTIFVLQKILEKTPQVKKAPSILALLFLLTFVISTILSNYLYTAVWGYYTRFNGGLISVVMFFGIYLIAKNVLDRGHFENILVLSGLTLIPIGIYSVIQHYGLIGETATVRAYSTFGQPNWLAANCSIVLPGVFFYFIREQDSESRLKVFWFITFILGFCSLWFSYSVSGLLGFVCSMSVAIMLNIQDVKANKKKFALITLFVLVIATTNLGLFKDRISDVFIDTKKIISSCFIVYAQEHNVSDSGFIRTGLWRGTLNLIFSNPKIFFFGTGPETFPYEFQPFRTLDLNYSSEWDFVFNKPHNYFLELWANTGVFSLIIYILFAYKALKTKNKFAIPALTALYVTNFFGWPTVATALLFWLYISYLDI